VPYLLMLLLVDGVAPMVAAAEWLLAKTDETTAAQAVPGTSVGEGQDWHGQPVNRFRRAASPTRLVLRCWAAAGSVLSALAIATRQDGARFSLLAPHTWAVTGYADLVFEALTPGSGGVTAAGVPLSLSNAPNGVNATCTVVSVAVVGLDAEAGEVYLPDVVAAYQGAGAEGGTDRDWRAWCKEVAGVYDAIVTSSAAGSVLLTVQAPGPSAPDAPLLDAVRAHLTAEHDQVDIIWTVAGWSA